MLRTDTRHREVSRIGSLPGQPHAGDRSAAALSAVSWEASALGGKVATRHLPLKLLELLSGPSVFHHLLHGPRKRAIAASCIYRGTGGPRGVYTWNTHTYPGIHSQTKTYNANCRGWSAYGACDACANRRTNGQNGRQEVTTRGLPLRALSLSLPTHTNTNTGTRARTCLPHTHTYTQARVGETFL